MDTDLSNMDLPALLQRCTVESTRFFQRKPYDQRYAYELLRRAFVERDHAAWEGMYQIYHKLVHGWVRRSSSSVRTDESSDYLVNGAFVRFWSAISPERFASFPTLASLLNYLQLCTRCVVIDTARASMRIDEVAEQFIDDEGPAVQALEDDVLERLGEQEFWRYILGQLHDEAERVVVWESFVVGMKPRAIFAAHTRLFGSTERVYQVKRYVLERLERDPRIRAMLVESRSE
jgi:DNA-directed RNA polymerase specialized sigma24 family protein